MSERLRRSERNSIVNFARTQGDEGKNTSAHEENFEDNLSSGMQVHLKPGGGQLEMDQSLGIYNDQVETGIDCGDVGNIDRSTCHLYQNGDVGMHSFLKGTATTATSTHQIYDTPVDRTQGTGFISCSSIQKGSLGEGDEGKDRSIQTSEDKYPFQSFPDTDGPYSVVSLVGLVVNPEEQIGPPVIDSCMESSPHAQSGRLQCHTNGDTQTATECKVEKGRKSKKDRKDDANASQISLRVSDHNICQVEEGFKSDHNFVGDASLSVKSDRKRIEGPESIQKKAACSKCFVRTALRYKAKCRTYKFMGLAVFYLSAVLMVASTRIIRGPEETYIDDQQDLGDSGHRMKRQADITSTPSAHNNTQWCDPKAGSEKILIMSYETFKSGGWLVHVLIGLYTFSAIAAICDVYFVPALEHICEDLKLEADVAGATFMAAASSAPEFCTSIIGIFVQKNDVGLGAIVGSSIFNLLAIIGLCAIFAGMPVELSWYPLTRDSIFYTVAVFEMLAFMFDQIIHWYEAVLMILTYAIYILVMVYNKKLEQLAHTPEPHKPASRQSSFMQEVNRDTSARIEIIRKRSHSKTSTSIRMSGTRLKHLQGVHSNHEGGSIPTGGTYTEPSMRSSKNSMEKGSTERMTSEHAHGFDTDVDPPPEVKKIIPVISPISEVEEEEIPVPEEPVEDSAVAEYENPLEYPEGTMSRMYWIAVLPITVIHAYTIPDSRIKDSWQSRLYMIPFIMSVVYLAIYSYIMVWAMTVAAWGLRIPPTVTGLTVLAAGTSVPDCLSSIFVARDGHGDMAVSNAIGSNVFDILLCLGIPWLITGITESGHAIEGEGMWVAGCTLAVTIMYLIMSLKMVSWTLTPSYGLVTLAFYVIIMTFCILVEMNLILGLHPNVNDNKCASGIASH